MIGVALAILGKTWKYLAAALFIAALYFASIHWLHNYADARAAPQIAAAKAETAAARAELTKLVEETRARAGQLALDWGAARDRAEQAEKELASERAKRFAGLASKAREGSGAVGSVQLPPSLVGVLNDSISAANTSAAPGPAPEPSEDPQASPTLADLAAAKVTCDAYYADAVDQILGLQRFYHDLQRNGAP